ncbi:GyrI-like domain-containing protein [uncultured Sphaerochaeta sp.]|uniref:GyrI-like domain-containing protein n=1 Tax=uncultured Sphaerochaeta sp. TaxID=886478 RepID=UPI002A0A7DB8|nr:GyrI-like domain-containing protein [uncultured Sphaerochaeta sp.]
MNFERCTKPSFSVIGKLGSTQDGKDMVQTVWASANAHFDEISSLASKDAEGNLLGFWGAMSDFSVSFLPWEDHFTKGLYLAGVQVGNNEEASATWTKWTIPAFEYLTIKIIGDYQLAFSEGLIYISRQGLSLVGAVQEYMSPKENGQLYLYFPIRRIQK